LCFPEPLLILILKSFILVLITNPYLLMNYPSAKDQWVS
jgi:hypothetical protein